MKRICIAFLVLASVTINASYPNIQKSVRPLQSEAGDNICTVSSINQKSKLWLTAAHCVLAEDGQTPEPRFIEKHSALVVFVDAKLDLAVLRVEDMNVPALHIAKAMPEVGSMIVMMGHPVGLSQIQYFQGHVSSLRTEIKDENVAGTWYMMFDMSACGGNSGSLVVNSKDEVVSVLQIGFGRPCSSFSGGATWQAMASVRRYFE